MSKKVVVAMSGGVDSSVAALLLQQQGYDICGVTLKLFDNEDVGVSKTKTCCSVTDILDAKSVCARLGIYHYVYNFTKPFAETVIDKFAKYYLDGLTPNPCIDCNRYIKFDELLKRAEMLDNDYIATGHYARIEYDSVSKRHLLKKALDDSKEQSYALYAITQKQISKILLPLGELTKEEVRKIADQHTFTNARKPDSQDICFVKNNDYSAFIEDYTGISLPKGNFVDLEGNILGQHEGIYSYTIGQRKGLKISLGRPVFVSRIDKDKNEVVLADEIALYSKRLEAFDVNLIAVDDITQPMRIKAKTRYRQVEQPATIFPEENGSYIVEFDEPQRAITPGQATVFYDGDIVVGGGTIKRAL